MQWLVMFCPLEPTNSAALPLDEEQEWELRGQKRVLNNLLWPLGTPRSLQGSKRNFRADCPSFLQCELFSKELVALGKHLSHSTIYSSAVLLTPLFTIPSVFWWVQRRKMMWWNCRTVENFIYPSKSAAERSWPELDPEFVSGAAGMVFIDPFICTCSSSCGSGSAVFQAVLFPSIEANPKFLVLTMAILTVQTFRF